MKLLNVIQMAAAAVRFQKMDLVLGELLGQAKNLSVTVTENPDMRPIAQFGVSANNHFEVSEMFIHYNVGLTKAEKVMAIAHELGHTIQFLGDCQGNYIEWVTYNNMTPVLELEEDAWMESVELLKLAGFDDWYAFERFACKNFLSYVRAWTRDEKAVYNHMENFSNNLRNKIDEVIHVTA